MFNLIDFQNWERKEHFEYYRTKIKCGYSCTVQLDVTNFLEKVKSNGLKFYPSFVYCVAKIVNSMKAVSYTHLDVYKRQPHSSDYT